MPCRVVVGPQTTIWSFSYLTDRSRVGGESSHRGKKKGKLSKAEHLSTGQRKITRRFLVVVDNRSAEIVWEAVMGLSVVLQRRYGSENIWIHYGAVV